VSLWPKGVNHARMTGPSALSKISHALVELAIGNLAFKGSNCQGNKSLFLNLLRGSAMRFECLPEFRMILGSAKLLEIQKSTRIYFKPDDDTVMSQPELSNSLSHELCLY
jgi:hypothetical protein